MRHAETLFTWILAVFLTKVLFLTLCFIIVSNIIRFFHFLAHIGLTFEWPEQVPFRLTHNMIEAMGPTGIEGSFRKCCEVTLRILRTEKDTLLSVLKPFVHDPLVEWSKKSGAKGEVKVRPAQTDLAEIKNEQVLPQSLLPL